MRCVAYFSKKENMFLQHNGKIFRPMKIEEKWSTLVINK